MSNRGPILLTPEQWAVIVREEAAQLPTAAEWRSYFHQTLSGEALTRYAERFPAPTKKAWVARPQ